MTATQDTALFDVEKGLSQKRYKIENNGIMIGTYICLTQR